MKKRESGFTLIEILVVITIIATLAGMVVLLIPTVHDRDTRLKCTNNLRNIVGLLEGEARYPRQSGPQLVLYLVRKGHIDGKDGLEGLFCPGDERESLKDAGGVSVYENLDLSLKGQHSHLTSYAGRDQSSPETRAKKGARAVVLVCDDSDDHHRGGIVVGLTGGVARWRDKVDDYDLGAKEDLIIGPGSQAPELACMQSD